MDVFYVSSYANYNNKFFYKNHTREHLYMVFVSYSHESNEHNKRVAKLVAELRSNGIETTYDEDMKLGQRMPDYMLSSIRKSQYVLYICTPEYKRKADNLERGVGYETAIITGEIYAYRNDLKFIPVLFNGTWNDVPYWALGVKGVDLSDFFTYEEQLNMLISNLKSNTLDVTENDDAQNNQRSNLLSRISKIDNNSDLKRCLDFYSNSVNSYVNDSTQYACAGMCFLKLKCYTQATNMFNRALNGITFDGDVFYYAALALCEGQRPFLLGINVIERIVKYIDQAIKIEKNTNNDTQKLKKYYLLAQIIYNDFYEKKGLNCSVLKSLISEKPLFQGKDYMMLNEYINYKLEDLL